MLLLRRSPWGFFSITFSRRNERKLLEISSDVLGEKRMRGRRAMMRQIHNRGALCGSTITKRDPCQKLHCVRSS